MLLFQGQGGKENLQDVKTTTGLVLSLTWSLGLCRGSARALSYLLACFGYGDAEGAYLGSPYP